MVLLQLFDELRIGGISCCDNDAGCITQGATSGVAGKAHRSKRSCDPMFPQPAVKAEAQRLYGEDPCLSVRSRESHLVRSDSR